MHFTVWMIIIGLVIISVSVVICKYLSYYRPYLAGVLSLIIFGIGMIICMAGAVINFVGKALIPFIQMIH